MLTRNPSGNLHTLLRTRSAGVSGKPNCSSGELISREYLFLRLGGNRSAVFSPQQSSAHEKGRKVMSGLSLAITPLHVILTIGGSIFLAELVGYNLHRILHSERFPALSRTHLIHHFLLYGPNQPMRAQIYKNATVGR